MLGWMLDNCSLYQLAWLNAWVFIIARLISALCKSNKPKAPKDNTAKVIEKSEEKISRIENDNGVAVVSVEKKQEVVVETAKAEEENEMTEWLVENTEEKLEEKTEEKIPEKPMKETVTIPKIVQPLSWHNTSTNKRKKDVKWWQRLVLLFTLGVAALIAWTLWEFLGNRWIGISLFLWRILYLVIGKLFDIDGFYNAKKLFTNWLYIILILAWIGYWVYTAQDYNSINLVKEKAISYVKDRFKSDKDNAELDTWDVIYVFEWTWEVITDTWDIDILDNTWDIENETWIAENIAWTEETNIWIQNAEQEQNAQPEVVAQPETNVQTEVKTEEQAPTSDDPNREVTMWEAIKHLLQWYTLSTKTDKSFTYVAKSNELYPYFKTAQEKTMIWFDTNPNKRVSCETYMSLKWILEWWKVNIYDKSQTRIIYWNKANELGKTNWCARNTYVKVKNL